MGRNFRFIKTLSERLYVTVRGLPLILPRHLAWREDVERRHVNRGLVEQSWLAMWPRSSGCFPSFLLPASCHLPTNHQSTCCTGQISFFVTGMHGQGFWFTQCRADIESGSQGRVSREPLPGPSHPMNGTEFHWTRRRFSKSKKVCLFFREERLFSLGVWVKWIAMGMLLLLLSHFSCVRPHRQQPTRFPRPWDSPG